MCLYDIPTGPVHESLQEMRQRLQRKRNEQEQIDKNQQILAESRQPKSSMCLDDKGEQRCSEKIVLLARGRKIPWINISLNHGGFKAATLHQAAANLQKENLGTLMFYGFHKYGSQSKKHDHY